MQRMSEEVFKKFLVFLSSNLDKNKELLKLVQKRYDDCDDTFRKSEDFETLVNDVRSKIETEKHRIFVHLKDFLAELKSHRAGSSEKKRKRDGVSNDLAKRLCGVNSCSDVSSDSDFFKKVKKDSSEKKKLKDDLSSVKSDSPKDVDASNSPSPSVDKKTVENSEVGIGKSKDKPWPISDEDSLSRDSVRSDAKSSDSFDLPLYLNLRSTKEPKSASTDLVSTDAKCPRSTSPSTSKSGLNKEIELAPASENAKTATESPQNQVSEAIPEVDVVIDDDEDDDDDGVSSDVSTPSIEVPAPSLGEVKEEDPSGKPDTTRDEVTTENACTDRAEETEVERKKRKGSERQIKRLEKLLGEIRDEIEKVTSSELTIDDMEEDDSSYVYEDKLQKKFVKVWQKLCELKGQSTSTGRPIEKKFRFNGTRYAEVNKRIEKFINKKKIFPDYNDIKKIITEVNNHYNLYLGKKAIEDLAREAFTDVGNQLQNRRHKNFILTFGNSLTEVSRITQDPALSNPGLRKKLDENRKLAKNRLDEVISKFCKQQYETNAQPEEVDDNAIESSSEEEEPQDIPELDAVMALSDEDEDEISEIPTKSPTSSESPFSKNLKVQIEKLNVPPGLLKKKPIPSSTALCPSSTVTSRQNVDRNDALALAIIPKTGLKPFLSHTSAYQNSAKPRSLRLPSKRPASSEIVIDLDDSSDADDDAGVDDNAEIIEDTDPAMQRALVPVGTRFPSRTVNTNNAMNFNPSASSSSSTMVMSSSQNNMQFSMQVKTQYQQQQKDGFSFKIASVSSLAYSIKDSNSNTQYFTSQQTNFQNQDIHLTPGTTYDKRFPDRPRAPAPSNSVIVLSDSD